MKIALGFNDEMTSYSPSMKPPPPPPPPPPPHTHTHTHTHTHKITPSHTSHITATSPADIINLLTCAPTALKKAKRFFCGSTYAYICSLCFGRWRQYSGSNGKLKSPEVRGVPGSILKAIFLWNLAFIIITCFAISIGERPCYIRVFSNSHSYDWRDGDTLN